MANEESTVIRVGPDEVDLAKLPAFTIGHKRRLFKELGLDLSGLGKFDPEQDFQFVWFVLRLVRPQTTEQEAEAVELADVLRITTGIIRKTARLSDIPSRGSSPSSVGTAGGDPEKSKT